jgi:cell division protein ZapA (FtsZ GTPase activity inhibitor)
MHVNACHTIFAASRNVTLTLPEDLRRRMKSVAAKTDRSISALPGLNATLLRKALVATFNLADNVEAVAAFLQKYATVPMSFADACLVRMSETIR